MYGDRLVKKINKLIVKIAQGDDRALEILFELTKKPLLYVAKTYLIDKSCAEDVLSETYLKAVNGAPRFDKAKNGYNWLYEITKNTALNLNRKFKPVGSLDRVPAYDSFDGLINRVAVEQAVSVLSDAERQIVYMYFFERKTISEVADALGKGKSAVHAQLQKILAKVKNILL